ncbi:MAG: PP2C family serine/threonine-protein phosphatase, partial [Gillisia sp.]
SVLKGKDAAINDKKTEKVYIGKSKNIVPEVNKEALVPLNDDIVILSSDGFYNTVTERSVQKILNDPMPVQTKAYRLIDTAIHAGTEDSASVQIIAFYNLDHTQRKFSPIKTRANRLLREKLSKKKDDDSESESKQVESSTLASLKRTLEQPATKYTLIILAALLIFYMFYDLFLYDPVPSVKFSKPAVEETSNLSDGEESAADSLNDSAKKAPEDEVYRVQTGDTWGRIYSRFEVCSWFIKNHPPNRGKFDSDENPVAGSQINIPLIYSGRRDLNPDFYQEFSMERTGSRCENANEEFLEKFREEYSDIFQ